MDSRNQSSQPSEASSAAVAQALFGPLEKELVQQCSDRYDAGISIRRLQIRRIEDDQNDVSVMKVKVVCRGITDMPVRLLVTCSSMCSYDVLCTVEEGSTHRFSYHLPGRTAPTVRQLVPLAQDLATFLRRELENRLGRLLLQSAARPPAHGRGAHFL